MVDCFKQWIKIAAMMFSHSSAIKLSMSAGGGCRVQPHHSCDQDVVSGPGRGEGRRVGPPAQSRQPGHQGPLASPTADHRTLAARLQAEAAKGADSRGNNRAPSVVQVQKTLSRGLSTATARGGARVFVAEVLAVTAATADPGEIESQEITVPG